MKKYKTARKTSGMMNQGNTSEMKRNENMTIQIFCINSSMEFGNLASTENKLNKKTQVIQDKML
jgi:hypothetical protein